MRAPEGPQLKLHGRPIQLSQIEDPEDQRDMLAQRLSGASGGEMGRRSRKAKAASVPAVRASKIKCPLPSGVVITVAGEEMSLEEMIEHLRECLRLAKKARDQHLDAKTAARVWADQAAAG